MPFSASTCLTNTGTTTLGPTFKVYANPISPTSPGTYLMDVPTSSITGGNCPYTFIVPDGTTSVRLFDPISFCYADVPVSSNNVCTTCNLSLSGVTNNLVSVINVNGLSGSCDADIANFVLDWYGPSPSTSLAFTSGKGSLFTGYQYTHPITNDTSPLLLDGTYTSKIRSVELNGVKFTSTGGTGNILSPSLPGCSSPVVVAPYDCSNITPNNPSSRYKNYKSFTYNNTAEPPGSLNATFKLSAGTEAFIWSFEAYQFYDTLKLIFNGSSYTNPILLEYINVGGNAGTTNFTPTTWPKIYSDTGQPFNTYFNKITSLTNLTVNNNDTITINLTPNPNTNATNWKLFFGCSTKPTATKTCLDSYRNNSYKIKASTIVPVPDSCGRYYFGYSVSGCTTNDNAGFVTSQIVQLSTLFDPTNISTNNSNNLTSVQTPSYSLVYNNLTIVEQKAYSWYPATCENIPNRQIKVVKNTTSQLEIYFTDNLDLQYYLSKFNDIKNSCLSVSGAYSSDSTTWNYYKYFSLFIYDGDFTCGDANIPYTELFFHYSSTASSGTSTLYPGFGYYMYITTPAIPINDYTCNSCSTCETVFNYVKLRANETRNLTGFLKNVKGIRLIKPFMYYGGLYSSGPTSNNQTNPYGGGWAINYDYSHNTYPASGVTNTLIPSLSASTWDWSNHAALASNGQYYQQVFVHQFLVTSWSPFQYKIQALEISNFKAIGAFIDVWSSTAGIINSNYVYP